MSFYSTYEELKLKKIKKKKGTLGSFYSTYEELKLMCIFTGWEPEQWFLQYLWGIETIDFPYRFIKDRLVFTVPMRNWNIATYHFQREFQQSFYSTYEELKHLI